MQDCDPEVYEKGRVVAVIGSWVYSEVIEAYVNRVARESGQRLDWHYFAGAAVIKAIGDLEKVDKVMYWDSPNFNNDLRDELKNFGKIKSCMGYFPGGRNHWSLEEEDG